MSDMSFKQAKELVERMEFSEIALKKAVNQMEKSSKTFNNSSKNFEKTLLKQDEIMRKIPDTNRKFSYLLLAVAVNVGFILGLLIGKNFL